jgi:thiamine-phosphate pyrophosphorylase
MALPTRIGRLRLPVLCFVVSTSDARDGDVERVVGEAIAGGATMVLLREETMPAGDLLALARRVKAVTRGKALLVVYDRVDVAIALEADGVHLPENGLPVRTARSLIGKYTVLGRSSDDHASALDATRDGAEWVLAGPIYKSASQPDEKPTGAKLLTEIVENSSIPVIAIGGITMDNVTEVVKAGAAGIAVRSGISGAADPKGAAEALANALKEAWAERPNEVAVGA